jgi:large subunit ribosomal protein L23
MRINNKIIRPIITEKSMARSAEGKYTFMINKGVTKGALTEELKNSYGVDVLSVRTMIMPGKPRRILKTSRYNKRVTWKKAIVTLKEGQSIDLFDQS